MSWYHPKFFGHSSGLRAPQCWSTEWWTSHLSINTMTVDWSNLQHLCILKMLEKKLDLGGIDASSRLTVIAVSVNQSRITSGQNWLHYLKTLWHASRETLLTAPGTNFFSRTPNNKHRFANHTNLLDMLRSWTMLNHFRCIKLHSKQ